jgi:pyruvate/2-oxoglutarate dehydrogenase complex dihydrolipoamide dehydrogenase (E3) component
MPAYDAIVIGTGQAGPALAARLSAAGQNVAVIERAKFGGTCVNDGCTPTKAMVASAYAAHLARRAGEYGVRVSGTSVDFPAVMARKDAIVARSSGGVEKWMEKNATVYRGHARFTGPDAVQVNGETLTAERIFVNVGGRPLVPDLPGLAAVPYLTNQSMMTLASLPAHLIVVGGSYIGLEFGQMMRRFGSKVTIVEMGPRLIGREDEDVSDAVKAFLEAEGTEVRLNATCLSVKKEAAGVSIGVDCQEGEPRVSGSHLLLAVGRVPNTGDLGLEKAGVKVDARGYIEVGAGLRTSNPRVWALGDCNGRGAFTHTAYNDYEIVADNLLKGASRKWTDRVPVYALYTDPPLGRVGMGEAEIRQAGIAALVGKRPMARVSRAVEKGETLGFLKVYVEASTRRVLGASLLGTSADEAVHSLIDAVYAKTPVEEFQRRVRIHPNVSELLPTVTEALQPLEQAHTAPKEKKP